MESIEKTEDGRIKCSFNNKDGSKMDKTDVYDTVLLAIGRDIETKFLNLESVNLKMDQKGKIITNDID